MLPAAVVLVVVAAYSAAAVLPRMVLSPPALVTVAPVVNSLLPQGWSFFTRSPREPDIAVYRLGEDGEAESVLLLPSNRPDNLFGISRRGRSEGVEMAIITAEVPSEAWIDCLSLPTDECLAVAIDAGLEPVPAINEAPRARLCGHLYLVEEHPVPFAYRNLVSERVVAEGAASVEVACQR